MEIHAKKEKVKRRRGDTEMEVGYLNRLFRKPSEKLSLSETGSRGGSKPCRWEEGTAEALGHCCEVGAAPAHLWRQ